MRRSRICRRRISCRITGLVNASEHKEILSRTAFCPLRVQRNQLKEIGPFSSHVSFGMVHTTHIRSRKSCVNDDEISRFELLSFRVCQSPEVATTA